MVALALESAGMDADARLELVRDTLSASAWHMATLEAVRELDLPDWAVGAGFVRNAVWDHLHGFDAMTPLNDVDVLYFDPSDLSATKETEFEGTLHGILPHRPWSVRNQARMHLRNCDPPYGSTVDAMSYWLETPTCVAARLDHAGTIAILAPHGLSDLVGMRGAPTARGRQVFDQYLQRMRSKNWPRTWPNVVVEGLE